MPDLVVAGAGLAGLVAAAEATDRGARVVVHEKGDRPGGSMLLSSGVIWRHRELDDFLRECPGGDPELQRLVHEHLDDDVAWLEQKGARVTERSTGNPRTTGVRFDTRSLTEILARRAGEVRLGDPLRELSERGPVVLATGGFQANRDLVRELITPEADALFLRATPWSTGDGLALGRAAGASTTAGLDELYGRNMPAPPARITEAQFVPLAQLYGHHAVIQDAEGEQYEPQTWSEIDVVQWTARRPGARATYRVPEELLGEQIRGRTIGEMVTAAERAGAPVRRTPGWMHVDVVAGITTTLGGLAANTDARVAPGVYAAGCDVGGISTGGYSSGLAAALVLGRIAARSALEGR
ncbi:MAG TPA: FAD-dependent oxidoreductase [Gaiella sp.]|nr:FAD-dependent oxidoreductase [Gaiella sp.]